MPQQSIVHPVSPFACTCPCESGSISSASARVGSSWTVGNGSNDPNKACCMTGNFPSTSAWYILIIPELTLSHVLTTEMSSSMGECQRKEAVLIELIKEIHERYMYFEEKASRISGSWIHLGLRCLWPD